MVADSVGLSAKDAIPRAFPGWDVTVTGRPAVFTDVAVTDYVAPAGALPDVAVVATGYNYPFWDPGRFDRSVDAMVDTLRGQGRAPRHLGHAARGEAAVHQRRRLG